MDLNLIQAFVDIVDAGNLAEAGRRRGVTRSQVSRQLRELEHQAGAQLLRRTTRRLELTEPGHALYQHGVRMLLEVASAQAEIDSLGKTLRGHVRVSVPTGLGDAYIAPMLLQFAHKHPGITLRVFFANRVNDLIAAEIDVALKVTSAPPLDHVAREICDIRWQLYASPQYLARIAPVQVPPDLAGCSFLCPPYPPRQFPLSLYRDGQRVDVALTPALQSEHFLFLARAVREGHGIGMLPVYIGWEEVRAGHLVPVLPDWRPEGLGNKLFIITTPNLHPSMATRALIGFLREELEKLEVFRDAVK
ncbi:LysR family transcriptional regulator [Cupriavidus alkaliphilus]|uniref:DNA-binding transcriptional LysR family regulator n=1 Tax=Cupriavidus alkaliphilus TaxID=942866 RepID=A0A7W4VF35_9BURK|nr:LysR family transcriptional regulator [Cupriavidus alkaliphilus]MBB3010430.1 DNA-binding transcriptional LysR family regulator [Cupriavidus alkaliphilus]PVY69095.1 LysR family transcriptional regulator [Cupriavidus alkaliphilus]SCB36643.1 transcriptional regulator, LysR family [Cupriavidus alkaliphilus]